jgi:hypothetical protein
MYNLGWINLVVHEPHIMVVFKTTLMSYVGDQLRFLIKKKETCVHVLCKLYSVIIDN